MDNVTCAKRISGIFVETGMGREGGREREGEHQTSSSFAVTCPSADSVTPCYSLSCGGIERHHLEDHLLLEEMK